MTHKKNQEGATVWFTGLACSGKTTIARKIKGMLEKRGVGIVILDSDELRSTVSKDFGYTKEERDRHMDFVSEICKWLVLQGAVAVASVISPSKASRDEAREKIKNFIEVYVKCPLGVCKERDVKGHYKDYEAGKLQDFVGMNIPYEEPINPDIVVETDKEDIDVCANKIISEMEKRSII